MARYPCSYIVSAPQESLKKSIIELLQACDLNIVYETHDYLMAREIPTGDLPFCRLVAVDVLIDFTIAIGDEVQVNFIVRNEELPLRLDNHCWRVFERVQQAFTESNQWQLLERVQ